MNTCLAWPLLSHLSDLISLIEQLGSYLPIWHVALVCYDAKLWLHIYIISNQNRRKNISLLSTNVMVWLFSFLSSVGLVTHP